MAINFNGKAKLFAGRGWKELGRHKGKEGNEATETSYCQNKLRMLKFVLYV
jgi:hypothetical protein